MILSIPEKSHSPNPKGARANGNQRRNCRIERKTGTLPKSQLFDVSINTLLGSPRQLVCQCCGMPLDDASISREPDGSFNEDYCKWCYTDGSFVYSSMEELLDFLADHMSNQEFPPEKAREYFSQQLPRLAHWAK